MKTKNKFLTQCKKCGCTEFLITELVSYKAGVNENGELDAYSTKGNEIESITCYQCDEEYSIDDFEDVIIDL